MKNILIAKGTGFGDVLKLVKQLEKGLELWALPWGQDCWQRVTLTPIHVALVAHKAAASRDIKARSWSTILMRASQEELLEMLYLGDQYKQCRISDMDPAECGFVELPDHVLNFGPHTGERWHSRDLADYEPLKQEAAIAA